MDFTKKGNREFFNSNLLFKTVGIIFLAIIFIFVVADIKMYQKKKELDSQVDAYKRQIEEIKKSSQTLKDEIANSDNVDYLEKLGYEQLDQARPGETEYMFVKSPGPKEVVLNEEKSWNVKLWLSWLSGPWQWIKNRF